MGYQMYTTRSIFLSFILIVATKAWAQIPTSNSQKVLVGGRVEVPEKGISTIPPEGWSVETNKLGATWLFKAPKSAKDAYERNIRVMAFKGPIYMDSTAFNVFANKIKENYSKATNAISNYSIRDLSTIQLADGTDAGMFYADFSLSKVPMMQMHILVSSADFHFLMSYTDTKKHFEDSSNGFLDEAYQSMISTQLSSRPPARYDFAMMLGIALGGLLVLLLGFSLFRWYKTEQIEQAYDDLEESEGDYEDSDDEQAESWKISAEDDDPDVDDWQDQSSSNA